MQRDRMIVLKFGGSVLRDRSTVERAVHEIHRWRRDGFAVVAVVSAYAGRTDQLLLECQGLGLDSGFEVAGRSSIGELESATALAAHLDRAGIRARVFTPGELRFLARGAVLDAEPIGVDVEPLRTATETDTVAVVPGFIAVDGEHRPMLLGRGGSDLSALVLAGALGCRCRLVKDVDGLYESDPAVASTPRPRRFAHANWSDVLATDGSIVQHKAARFAQAHGLGFEISAANAVDATTVGAGPARWTPPAVIESAHRLRVALLGLGSVGSAVAERLLSLPDLFQLARVGVRDPSRDSRPRIDDHLLADAWGAASSGVDVVIEVMGGIEPARSLILEALASGSHVVTANKAVLALHGTELHNAARCAGRRLLYSAAVGGATPVIETLRTFEQRPLRRIRGVLNATANFVLGALRSGCELDVAIGRARRAGFAETDPSRDLDGRDAADKLAVIAQCVGLCFDPSLVPRDSIRSTHLPRTTPGAVIRQVATLENAKGRLRAEVELAEVQPGDPLHDLPDEWTAVTIDWAGGETRLVAGRGAGGRPTAEAVIGDLLELKRSEAREPGSSHRSRSRPRPIGSACSNDASTFGCGLGRASRQ